MSTEHVGAEVKFSQAQAQHIVRELKLAGLAEPPLSGQQGYTRGRIPTRVASGSKGWENVHLLNKYLLRSYCLPDIVQDPSVDWQ